LNYELMFQYYIECNFDILKNLLFFWRIPNAFLIVGTTSAAFDKVKL